MKEEQMYDFVAATWGVMAVVASCVSIAFYIQYKKDVKWNHRDYLWEYIDKKYDIVFVEKENHE